MEVTHSEIVLLILIAILFIVIAKQQARIRMLMYAGSGLTQALRSIADGTGEIKLTEDDELVFKKSGGNDGTSK
jgi:hypothetical protein